MVPAQNAPQEHTPRQEPLRLVRPVRQEHIPRRGLQFVQNVLQGNMLLAQEILPVRHAQEDKLQALEHQAAKRLFPALPDITTTTALAQNAPQERTPQRELRPAQGVRRELMPATELRPAQGVRRELMPATELRLAQNAAQGRTPQREPRPAQHVPQELIRRKELPLIQDVPQERMLPEQETRPVRHALTDIFPKKGRLLVIPDRLSLFLARTDRLSPAAAVFIKGGTYHEKIPGILIYPVLRGFFHDKRGNCIS